MLSIDKADWHKIIKSMIEISNLKKINPNDPNLKMIVPKEKGIYFWIVKNTEKLMYIGKASGKEGLYRRIIGQHLRPAYIEYRENKGRNQITDAYQIKYAIIRERDGAKGIDQSSFRRSVGSAFNIKPGIHTVNYIKDNFYLIFIVIKNVDEIKAIEKEMIITLKPFLNKDHNR
ncbi:MAG: hypothetical protein ACI93N_002109 [Flavobacteriaceae bacterium]|jgi:hypothetical protein